MNREKNTIGKRKARGNQTDNLRTEKREKNTTERRKARQNLSKGDKQNINESRKQKRLERLEKDPNYRESWAAAKAKRWKAQLKALNKTIQGRKGIFSNSVKYGPIFVCMCCKRKLYDNAVIRISLGYA